MRNSATRMLQIIGFLLLPYTLLFAQSVPDFNPPSTYLSNTAAVNPTMYWSAAGDFNGDGRMDLAAPDTFADNVVGSSNILGFSYVLANPGGGYSAPVSKSIGLRLQAMQAADFNHDGRADLVVEGPNGAALLLADPAGDFSAPAMIPLPFTPSDGAIGDFNADGNMDVVIAGSAGYAVLLGTGTGAFQPATFLSQSFAAYHVLTGDLNNDGKLDFTGTGASYLGNGDGTFRAPVTSGINDNGQLADFDGDGILDLVKISTQASSQDTANYFLTIARGLGDGQFISYFDWVFRTRISGLVAGDFNADGRPDVVIYDFSARTLRVLAGVGGWMLGGNLYEIALPGTGALIGADMDGNGSQDLVYSNYREYHVLRNTHGNSPLLAQLTVNPASVVGGAVYSTGTVSLGGLAPAGSAVVTLSSNNPAVFFPSGSTVTIPAGTTSASFQIASSAVAVLTSSTITATSAGVSQTAQLTLVTPYDLAGLSVNPASQYGIFTVGGSVALSGPADSSATVALTSANPAVASVPASVTVPARATSASFTITLRPVTVNTPVAISASLGGVNQNSSVTVLRPIDMVTISRAQYTAKSVQLRVEATSTSAATTITVYDSASGALIGTLSNAGGGKYNGTLITSFTGTNASITLKSTLGGTVAGPVQFR
jgi:hypothetical protein